MFATVIAPPPDLLRRFVPRPCSVKVDVEGFLLTVESNDDKILEAFLRCGRRTRARSRGWSCNLMRDDVLQPSASAPLVLHHGSVTVLRFGPGTQIGVDAEEREIAGYIGIDMETDFLAVCVVPEIVRAAKLQGRRRS